MASGMAPNPYQNRAEAFRHLNRIYASWSQESIDLWKFCNNLTNPKSSEIVLQGEPFFLSRIIVLCERRLAAGLFGVQRVRA